MKLDDGWMGGIRWILRRWFWVVRNLLIMGDILSLSAGYPYSLTASGKVMIVLLEG